MNDWVTWINTAVGLIGIIVGLIGVKNIYDAKKIFNSVKAGDNANIQQAEVIYNGLDNYAVIKLSKEATKEELEKVISEMQPLREADLEELFMRRISPTEKQLMQLKEDFDKQPKISFGREEPTNLTDGDIYIKIE